MSTTVPSPPIPPQRWPGLVAAVGGEAAIAKFMAANLPDDGMADRWEQGFSFQPNDCNAGNDELPLVACHGDAFQVNSSEADLPAAPHVDALYYWTVARCSTFGNDPQQTIARAEDKLARATSYKLEKEFWRGDAAVAKTLDTQYLSKSSVTKPKGNNATPLVYALAVMQSSVGTLLFGGRAMIHVTPATATLLLQHQVIRKEQGYLLDVFDNIIVAGSGYDGSGTDHIADSTGDTAWMYGTPVVNVRLGKIGAINDTLQRIDQTNNVNTAIAYRPGAVSMDPCGVIAVLADLCSTLCVPG